MLKNITKNIMSLLVILLPISTFAGKAVIDINLSLIALIFLIKIIVEKNFHILNQKWFKILILFWAYMVFIALFAKYPEIALKKSLPWVRFPIFALALSEWLFKDEKNIKLFFKSLFFMLFFVMFDGLIQVIFGVDIFGIESQVVGVNKDQILITAFLKDHILGFHITFLIFPLMIYMIDQIKDFQLTKKINILYMIFLLLAILIVTLSGDRMAWLLFCFGIFLTIIFYGNLRKYFVPLALLAFILISIAFFYKQAVFQRQIIATYNDITNFWDSPYGLCYKNGFEVAKLNPIFGVGAKHFRHILAEDICGIEDYKGLTDAQLRTQCPGHYLHPHNFFIEIFAESGLIGLLIFLYFLFIIFRDLFNVRDKLISNPILFGAALTFFLRFWPLSATMSFYAAYAVSSSFIMVGIIYAMLNRSDKSNLQL